MGTSLIYCNSYWCEGKLIVGQSRLTPINLLKRIFKMNFTKTKRLFFSAALIFASSSLSHAATIGADGGITLYISYDNLDLPGGTSWNDNITQIDVTAAASCSPTNSARA